jgi:hypothetical protein
MQLLEHGGICWYQSSSNHAKQKLLKMQIAVFQEIAPSFSAPQTPHALQCPPFSPSDNDVNMASLLLNPDIHVHPSIVLRHVSVTTDVNTTVSKRAVFATSKLAHGEVIMKIPKQSLISKETLKESAAGQFVLSLQTNVAIWQPLFSVFLLFEKEDPASKFKDIICHLSDSYLHSAHFWPQAAIKTRHMEQEDLLRLTFMFNFYNQMAPAIASRYGKTVPWSFFEFRSFLWAYFSASANSIFLGGPDSLSTIPGLHQFQHSLKPNLKLILDSSSHSFYNVIVSRKKGIAEGHELTFSHGAFCNKELIFRYGFAVEGNKIKC